MLCYHKRLLFMHFCQFNVSSDFKQFKRNEMQNNSIRYSCIVIVFGNFGILTLFLEKNNVIVKRDLL